MRADLRLLALVAGLLLLRPSAATAQFEFLDAGVYGASATESFGGSLGLGAFVSWNVPVLPVAFRATAEKYFPDCGIAGGCSTWSWGADALVSLPLPVVHPYAVVGWTERRTEAGNDVPQVRHGGIALGAGVDAELMGIRAFAEARRELIDLAKDQWVLRLGLFIY